MVTNDPPFYDQSHLIQTGIAFSPMTAEVTLPFWTAAVTVH